MAPPSTFFALVISRNIFMDPDPFVNSYFGLSFDLRRYLAQSDIFEAVKQGLEKNNFRFLHSELVTKCDLGQNFSALQRALEFDHRNQALSMSHSSIYFGVCIEIFGFATNIA